MPMLDLGELTASDFAKPMSERTLVAKMATFRLYAYAFWPNDEDRRREYNVVGGSAAANIARRSVDDFILKELESGADATELAADIWIFNEIVNQTFIEPFGGLGAIAMARSTGDLDNELKKRFDGFYATGVTLLLTRMMAEDDRPEVPRPSLKKARHIQAELQLPPARDVRTLYRYWREFRPAAHIAAAYVLWNSRNPGKSDDEVLAHQKRFWGESLLASLLVAENFASYATAGRSGGLPLGAKAKLAEITSAHSQAERERFHAAIDRAAHLSAQGITGHALAEKMQHLGFVDDEEDFQFLAHNDPVDFAAIATEVGAANERPTDPEKPAQPEPILSADKIFHLPAEFGVVPMRLTMPNLTDEMLEALKSYKAPIPYP